MIGHDPLPQLLRTQRRGILATIKQDGQPHLSNVGYTYDRAAAMLRISTTASRVKSRNLRRDPRATLLATTADLGAYAVAEGRAELSPVADDPADATVEELVLLYRSISGEHPDWLDYRRAMVNEQRLVIRLHVDRIYGWVGQNT